MRGLPPSALIFSLGPGMSERLIKTEGCYIGIFDALSAANAIGLFATSMHVAKRRTAAMGQRGTDILEFNQLWIDAAARGEILVWVVLFDGVYKVIARVLPFRPSITPTMEQTTAFLGQEYHALFCPSGRIMVASLSDLGSQSLEPLVVVEPGTYHVALTVDDSQEAKHGFLDDVAQYPPTDGPDWSIKLWST